MENAVFWQTYWTKIMGQKCGTNFEESKIKNAPRTFVIKNKNLQITGNSVYKLTHGFNDPIAHIFEPVRYGATDGHFVGKCALESLHLVFKQTNGHLGGIIFVSFAVVFGQST